MLKKTIQILLAVLLLVQLIGCASSRDLNDEYEPWKKEKGLKKVTLNLYLPLDGKEYTDYYGHTLMKVVLKNLNKWLQDELNTTLCIANFKLFKDNINNRYFYKVTKDYEEALKTNETCDMFISGGIKGTNLKVLADEGIIKDLTSLFPRYAPGYKNLFSAEELSSVSHNGKLYAIPSYNLPKINRYCAIVREDLAKKYIPKGIKSIEDFERFMQAIKDKEPDLVPSVLFGSTMNIFADYYGYSVLDGATNISGFKYGNILNASSFELVYKRDDKNMKLIPWEQVPEYREALGKILDWKMKYNITATSGYGNELYAMAGTDTYASFIGQTGMTGQLNKILENNGVTSKRFVEYDLFPQRLSSRSFFPDKYICINAKSRNAERAVMFIEWLMFNQDNYDLFMYGIKDKDYVIDDSGNIKIMPPTKDGVPAYAEEQRLWCFKNDYREHLGDTYIKDYKRKLEKLSRYPLHMGAGSYLTGNIWNDQLSYHLTVNQSLFQESSLIFKSYDEIELKNQFKDLADNFLPRQKVDADNFTAVIQQQLDAWRNSKH